MRRLLSVLAMLMLLGVGAAVNATPAAAAIGVPFGSAHIRCNGVHYATGNYSTPIAGGWGPWARVECPGGASWSSAWHTTRD